jgi:hypothetical protein
MLTDKMSVTEDTDMDTDLKPCECEHAAHFFDDGPRQHTPHGNPGHVYGTRFVPRVLSPLKTTYGTFTVCADCASDCLALDQHVRTA